MIVFRPLAISARGPARLAALLCSAALACSPADSTAPEGTGGSVHLVAINPTTAQLGLGSTLQLKAIALDVQGNEIAGRQTFWASGDTLVAVVSSSGLVTARNLGAAQIQAVIEGKPALAFVTVVARPVATVAVAPGTASIAAGSTVQLQATTAGDDGSPLADRLVFWQSSNNAVATVTSTGLVRGEGAGSATITATSEGKSGSATISVTGTAPPVTPPPGGGTPAVDSVKVLPNDTTIVRGETARFRATVYAGGRAVTGRNVVWSTSTPAILEVNAATGDVKGLRQTTGVNEFGTVNAAVEGKVGSVRVRVTNKPAKSVSIVSPGTSLEVNQEVEVSATPRDADGQVVGDYDVTWSSTSPTVISVTSTGSTSARVTGKKEGTGEVIAAVVGVAGVEQRLSFTVVAPTAPTPPPPARAVSVNIGSVPTAPLTVGQTHQLAATARDANGAELQGRSFTWSSSNTAVATVNGTGLVSAVSAGSVTITATTTDGALGSATIVVAPTPAASVDVSPATSTLDVGQTRQLTPTVRDAGGNSLPGRSVTWNSSNTGVATVSGAGIVTAIAPGSATITATTTDGAAGSATVTVNTPAPPPPAPVATVTVAPPSATIDVGQTVQLAATARDASGAEVPNQTFTWSSSNTGVATVSATGLVTAVAAGSATISATSANGKVGSAAITVNAPPPAPLVVARVDVTPSSVTLSENSNQNPSTAILTARLYADNGTEITGRSCTWTGGGEKADGTGKPLVTIEPLSATTARIRSKDRGTTTVRATCDGKSGTASVTVVN